MKTNPQLRTPGQEILWLRVGGGARSAHAAYTGRLARVYRNAASEEDFLKVRLKKIVVGRNWKHCKHY